MFGGRPAPQSPFGGPLAVQSTFGGGPKSAFGGASNTQSPFTNVIFLFRSVSKA